MPHNLTSCDQWAEKLLEGVEYMTFLNFLYIRST